MNHPSREEFVPYVFGETRAEVTSRLREHLRGCPECREEVERWKRSLGRLDAWKLPRANGQWELARPFLKWALAGACATMVMALGYAAGRLASPTPNLAQMRQAVAAEVREQLREDLSQSLKKEIIEDTSSAVSAVEERTKELLTAYSNAAEDARSDQERRFYDALDQLESRWQVRRLSDYITLKKDLDTVAVNTDASLRNLAHATPALASPGSIKPISVNN